MATDHLVRLTRLTVMDLDERPVAKELAMRAAYYDQRQNDAMRVDWEGRRRVPGETYMQSRQRLLGFIPATPESIPWGNKRPTCPTSFVGYAVDTYTALLLGEGRTPSIRVAGDDDTGDLVHALLEHSCAWDALAEARTIAGAEGAAAIVPEVEDGVPSHRAMSPENLYVEWKRQRDWVPDLVIEQKRVQVEFMDENGQARSACVWRTRAWDATYAYIYEDVLDEGPRPEKDEGEGTVGVNKQDIELAQAPIPHGAERCPVVWLQNTRDSDSQYGEPDCEPVYEQIDQLDRLLSMIVRGSKANVDPTLVVSDKQYAYGRNSGKTLAKGYGQSIRLSESGKASLLEIAGDSVKTSWATFDKVMTQIERRTGVMSPDPERSGAYQSGVALQILHQTQDTRAAARRKPLGIAIVQLIRVWIAMVRNLRAKVVGAQGDGIEIPQREVSGDDGEKTLAEHVLGPGGAITLNWPPFHSPTPTDLEATARALQLATGNKQTMSQESAVAFMINMAQTDTDPQEEMERIEEDGERKVAGLDALMRPDPEGLAGIPPIEDEDDEVEEREEVEIEE